MAKVTLNDVAVLSDSLITAINSNNTAIENAIENTLSRDGTSPNSMSASLDMNSNRILNLPDPATDQEPATKSYVDSHSGGGGGGGGSGDWSESDFSSLGLTLAEVASAAAARTALGTVIGTDVQAYDAELAAFAGLTSAADKLGYFTGSGTMSTTDLTSTARSLLDDTSTSAMRTTLGVAIGTNVQAWDADLDALAGLTSAADKVPYFTGSGTAAVADFTSTARSLLDDSSTSAMRTTLGLAIGTDVQAYDAELAAFAGLTSAADKIGYFTGSGTMSTTDFTSTARSLLDDTSTSAMRTTLGLAIGSDVQAYDAELSALAGLTSAADKIPYFTGSGTASVTDFTSTARSLLDDTSTTAMRTTLGLGTAATQNTGTSGTNVPLLDGGNTWSANQTLSSASLILSGNISGAGIFGTTGVRLQAGAVTFTDTSSSGTIADARNWNIGGNTWAASSSTTLTNAYSVFITTPTAGSNVTMTNKWALGISGNVQVTGSISAGDTNDAANPQIRFKGYATGFYDVFSNGSLGIAVSGGLTTFITTNGFYVYGRNLFVQGGSVYAENTLAIPAGGSAGHGVLVSETANFGMFFGSGAPSLSAAKGSIYLRSDGSGVNDRMYVNTDGSTTWTSLVTVA